MNLGFLGLVVHPPPLILPRPLCSLVGLLHGASRSGSSHQYRPSRQRHNHPRSARHTFKQKKNTFTVKIHTTLDKLGSHPPKKNTKTPNPGPIHISREVQPLALQLGSFRRTANRAATLPYPHPPSQSTTLVQFTNLPATEFHCKWEWKGQRTKREREQSNHPHPHPQPHRHNLQPID